MSNQPYFSNHGHAPHDFHVQHQQSDHDHSHHDQRKHRSSRHHKKCKSPEPCPKPKSPECIKQECCKTCCQPLFYPQPYYVPCCPPIPCIKWRVVYLISNETNQALHQDQTLINPWGIVIAKNQLWIASNGTDIINNYDLTGNQILAPIIVRNGAHNQAFPTGLVVNCTGGFQITCPVNNVTRPSFLLIATENGTVAGWNPDVNATHTVVVINTSRLNSVYRGLTIANGNLYVADFYNRKIDVFDSNYTKLTGFPFVDGDFKNPLPADYGPNNIVLIGCYLYVLYSKKDPSVPVNALSGPGNGYINIFRLDGTFVKRFASRGKLNNPWGMIPTPDCSNFPEKSFFVANTGDGFILLFQSCGKYLGKLKSAGGLPIIIDGIRGLAPYYTECQTEIFFTAGPKDESAALVGAIQKEIV